jgi:guanine deaminase
VDLVRRTIELALENVENGGRPFACVISRDGEVVAENPNLVVQTRDPTAHFDRVAVRQACQRLETENLEGHEIYVLAHPCPMCLGALYYCSPDRMAFVTTRDEYSRYYKDDRKYFELETSTTNPPSRGRSAGCRWSIDRTKKASKSTDAGAS